MNTDYSNEDNEVLNNHGDDKATAVPRLRRQTWNKYHSNEDNGGILLVMVNRKVLLQGLQGANTECSIE